MNNTTKKLYGFVESDENLIFIVPVFNDSIDASRLYVQNSNEKGTISEFEIFSSDLKVIKFEDAEKDALIVFKGEMDKKEGDEFLWAFKTLHGKLIFGTKSEIKELLEDEYIPEFFYAFLEVMHFSGKRIQADAFEKCLNRFDEKPCPFLNEIQPVRIPHKKITNRLCRERVGSQTADIKKKEEARNLSENKEKPNYSTKIIRFAICTTSAISSSKVS